MRSLFRVFIPLWVLLTACIGCKREEHFISDPKYRQSVEIQFAKQRKLAAARDSALFSVFDASLNLQEEEALKFLYAYMPLSDLADYNGDFFLENVRYSLAARDTFSWGKTIPEEIYRHFVLPPRVNNENLDTARMVFFKALKDRVKNLSMKDAILEVNHYCHENVSYRGTDGRTSAPLATIQTAYGRCGEESTLTVAALRAVGIPARQCYTPRWAHTDDNHAWVEVWADGKWYFIGACEPEFELNLAWFTGPAMRAMLVGTNVYGDYRGPEEVLFKNEYYTRINLIANYAPVKTFAVKVLDASGKPCDSAEVEFCLYNYAEFFPVARKFTDVKGLSGLTTGLGDLLVWANNGKDFGFEKVSVEKTDTCVIRLNRKPETMTALQLDFVPPVERPVKTTDDPAKQERNRHLLKIEDSIRNKYISTFADSLYSLKLARELSMNSDSVWNLMNRSEGNWRNIETYLRAASAAEKRFAMPLLYAVSDKDLRDTPSSVLLEHLRMGAGLFATSGITDENFFVKQVMNPRISIELLRPFRKAIIAALGAEWGKGKDAADVIDWINTNITINTVANYYNVSVSPAGTLSLRVADKHSRDILFVAICRTYGFAARLEPATDKPQYYMNAAWTDVNFESPEVKSQVRGTLILTNGSADPAFMPVYYTHYTIALFKNGKYRTLDYEGSPDVAKLPARLTLEPGHYMMVTGSRRGDGSVLASLKFFDVTANGEVTEEVKLRDNSLQPKALGTLESALSIPEMNNATVSIPLVAADAKGQLLIWADPDKEPTRHVISEIQELRDSYDKNASPLLIIFSEKTVAAYKPEKFSNLPKSTRFGIDQGNQTLARLESAISRNFAGSLPVIAVVNAKGEILYAGSGYSIGTGALMLKYLNAL
jgi:transglutaminase-like putative cysteine protease